jgi:hypothetical protein
MMQVSGVRCQEKMKKLKPDPPLAENLKPLPPAKLLGG